MNKARCAHDVVGSIKYGPYGRTRATTGAMPTDKLYTGQQQEPGDTLGLYNYKARFYSTALGRFLSADSIAQSSQPSFLNRFAYAMGNPMAYADPSGHCSGAGPCPEPVPEAGDHDQYDRTQCRAHFAACASYAMTLKHGTTKWGLIVVMGLFQSMTDLGDGDLGAYGGYGEAFLDKYHPGCAGSAESCWSDVKTLMAQAGAEAVYEVFGIQFIESDPSGWGTGILAGIRGVGYHGEDEIRSRLENPLGKEIFGVIGHSLGAAAVGEFFALNGGEFPRTAFFLDSAPDFLLRDAAEGLPQYAGGTGFFHCGDDCGASHHGTPGRYEAAGNLDSIRATYESLNVAPTN